MPDTKPENPPAFIAVVQIRHQCSPEYDTYQRTVTMILRPETTIAEVMKWRDRQSMHCLGASDLTIVQETGGAS